MAFTKFLASAAIVTSFATAVSADTGDSDTLLRQETKDYMANFMSSPEATDNIGANQGTCGRVALSIELEGLNRSFSETEITSIMCGCSEATGYDEKTDLLQCEQAEPSV